MRQREHRQTCGVRREIHANAVGTLVLKGYAVLTAVDESKGPSLLRHRRRANYTVTPVAEWNGIWNAPHEGYARSNWNPRPEGKPCLCGNQQPSREHERDGALTWEQPVTVEIQRDERVSRFAAVTVTGMVLSGQRPGFSRGHARVPCARETKPVSRQTVCAGDPISVGSGEDGGLNGCGSRPVRRIQASDQDLVPS